MNIKETADALDTIRNSGNKQKFHTVAKSFLRAFVKELGIENEPYNVRSNRGGPAVLGEAFLHTNHLYICLGEYSYWRVVNDIKDFTGGNNNSIRYTSDLLKIDYEAIKLRKAEKKLRNM